ncbi:MAG: hypothetical protein CBB70_10250 [Planctomycetaceae bacterium TMED10]|nr:MAG: hypothetical protein CBB70_10250 [Planctomycetaceae bacterium TMED10]
MKDQPVEIQETDFREMKDCVHDQGPQEALQKLAARLQDQGRYHEYFEARLMQCRFQAGLPLGATFQTEEVPEEVRDQLEQSYLQICTETGRLFLGTDNLREAWMYLRTVDDREPMRQALHAMEVNEQNIDSVLEIAIYEGVDLAFGFKHLLAEMGTCNAITTYESVMPAHSITQRKQIAGLLVEHLHHELASNLCAAMGTEPVAEQFATDELTRALADVEGTFGEYTVHVDASHLSSVVRFAEIIDDRKQLERAYDLTLYGQRLHENFQFPCPAPFEKIYDSHCQLFGAQLGKDVNAAVDYFRKQAQQAHQEEGAAWPVEVYVMLLDRLGQASDALLAGIELYPHDRQLEGVAPSLLELAAKSGDYAPLLEHYQRRGELLTFTAALIQQQ